MPYSLNNYLTKINSEPLAWVGGTMPYVSRLTLSERNGVGCNV